MAKRRVGNPLFDTEEAEQLINLQNPGFLQGLDESGIPESESIEGVAMEEPMVPDAPPMPVKDARQIPLNPEDDPQLKDVQNTPNSLVKSMYGVDLDNPPKDARNTPNDWVKSMYGIDLDNPPEEEYPQGAMQGIASLAAERPLEDNSNYGEGFIKGMSGDFGKKTDDTGQGFLRGLTGFTGDFPEKEKIAPGEDMYTKGMSTLANQMFNSPMPPKDESPDGMNFARALGGQLPEGYSQEDLANLGLFAGNQPEAKSVAPTAPQQNPNQAESPQQAKVIQQVSSGAPPAKPQITENEIIQKSQQDSKPVSGAVSLGMQNPYVKAEIERLNGIAEIPPELTQFAEDWEAALTKQKEERTARQNSLIEKLENNQMSDFDKIGLALAVAVPLVMGLMYGGAGFALGAGLSLEAYGKHKSGQENEKSAALKELKGMGREEAKQAEEGLKLVKTKQEIENNIPNKEVSNFIKNKKFREFGEDVAFNVGDEDKILWMNTEKLADKEDLNKIKDRTKEAEETIGTVSNFNKQLDGIDDILIAIQDQDPGMWNVLKNDYSFLEKNSPDRIANSSFADILSMISKSTGAKPVEIEVVGRDGKTRKVNALEALSQQVKALQNDYNSSVLKGSRLTQNVMTHWAGIMFDPKAISQFMTQGVNGWQENAFNLRNIMNRKIQEELTGYGFMRQPIQEKYPVMEREILRPVAAVNRDIINNPDAYKNKVR